MFHSLTDYHVPRLMIWQCRVAMHRFSACPSLTTPSGKFLQSVLFTRSGWDSGLCSCSDCFQKADSGFRVCWVERLLCIRRVHLLCLVLCECTGLRGFEERWAYAPPLTHTHTHTHTHSGSQKYCGRCSNWDAYKRTCKKAQLSSRNPSSFPSLLTQSHTLLTLVHSDIQ